MKNHYQITTFISNDFLHLNKSLFDEAPNEVYSFGPKNQKLYDDTFKNTLENIYALQESFIVFYTSSLSETESFIDFLIPHLSVRKRPKCLIVCENSSEINVSKTLDNAWKNKFLDFSVIVMDFLQKRIDSVSRLYYLNPFTNIIHRRKLTKNVRVFPEKLINAYGYPFFVVDFGISNKSLYMRQEYARVKIIPSDVFVIDLTGRFLNLKLVKKNGSNQHDDFPIDYLKNNNFDVFPKTVVGGLDYLNCFIIPVDMTFVKDVVAIVPILPISKINISFKSVLIDVIISIAIFSLIVFFKHFSSPVMQTSVFDMVRVLFGQSIVNVPIKTAHRIIFVTFIIASVKIMNDFLLDVLAIQIEQGEKPFNTYQDLYISELQTYSQIPYLNMLKPYDVYLSKIINRTLYMSTEDCLWNLMKWSNVSCIVKGSTAKVWISLYLNPDKSAVMKVARPPIFSFGFGFYWFVQNSPFAMRFFEIIQRLEETKVMHMESLLSENGASFNPQKKKNSDWRRIQ